MASFRSFGFIAAGLSLAAFSGPVVAQQQSADADRPAPFAFAAPPVSLPDSPTPQPDAARLAVAQNAQQQPAQNPPAAQNGSAQNHTAQPGSSSSQAGSQAGKQQPAGETQHQKAEEQLKQEEQQRVLGIVPNFNTSYISNAASLTAGQKIQLAFKSATDPFTFAAAFMVAGYHEALDEDTGFGWGPQGYFKRSGAAYLDAFDGDMIGNGILPGVFHQDPRYFRLGYGSFTHRLFYAISTSYICKHDNTGKWEPNYSNVGGNIIAGAISNLYYPSQNSGWGQTISNGMIVTTEGTIGGVFQEFWPDVSRKVLHKDPTHGLDAQARARYKAEKQQEQSSDPARN